MLLHNKNTNNITVVETMWSNAISRRGNRGDVEGYTYIFARDTRKTVRSLQTLQLDDDHVFSFPHIHRTNRLQEFFYQFMRLSLIKLET